MKKHQKTHFCRISAFLLSLLFSAISFADVKRATWIVADSATGANRFLGAPIRDLGEPFGLAGFNNVFAFTSNGTTPTPLSEFTDPTTVLATGVDEAFLALLGLTIDDVDPDLLNVPYRQVPVNVSPDGNVRQALPATSSVPGIIQAQANPTDNITLADWLRARGQAEVKCYSNGAHVTMIFRRLIPNRLYTIWGVFAGPAGLTASPFGGAPNVFVTDNKGRAKYRRQLSFCPFDESDSPLLFVDVVYHSDLQNYGAVPELPLQGLHTGIVTHTQLEFSFRGESID